MHIVFITLQGQAHTVLSIDLSSYEDFSLILPNDDDPYKGKAMQYIMYMYLCCYYEYVHVQCGSMHVCTFSFTIPTT